MNISSHQTIMIPENAKVTAPKKLAGLERVSSRSNRYVNSPENTGVINMTHDHASIWGRMRKRKDNGWKTAD